MQHGLSARFQQRYELGQELGHGSFGFVMRARDRKDGADLAIKFYRGDALGTWEARRQFLQEAELLAAIRHPNVVKVFGYGEEGEHLFIAFECIAGRDLREWIDLEAPLPLDAVLSRLETIAQGLAAIHQQRIVHRDLKPANVMEGADGVLKIIDLGLARTTAGQLGAAGDSERIQGTPVYMSPEQATAGKVGYASDIYALGVMAYEMLAGDPPFMDEHPLRVLEKHVSELPESLQSRGIQIPAAAEDLIMQCLEKDPADRPKGATALVSAIRRLRKTLARGAAAATVQTNAPKSRLPERDRTVPQGIPIEALPEPSRKTAGSGRKAVIVALLLALVAAIVWFLIEH